MQDAGRECSVTNKQINQVYPVGRGGHGGPHGPQGGHCCGFRPGVLAIFYVYRPPEPGFQYLVHVLFQIYVVLPRNSPHLSCQSLLRLSIHLLLADSCLLWGRDWFRLSCTRHFLLIGTVPQFPYTVSLNILLGFHSYTYNGCLNHGTCLISSYNVLYFPNLSLAQTFLLFF